MSRGEFEAAPKVAQPAVVIRRKSSKGLLLSTIIFVLIAVGLGVWVAILLVNQQKNNNVGGGETSKETTIDNPERKDSGDVEESTKGARIGYAKMAHCSIGYLTKGGDFYVSATDSCDSMYGGKPTGINAADAATGQNGSFTVSYGEGQDLAEYEVLGTNSNKLSIEGLKVNDSNIVAFSIAERGQNWTGEKYVLVKDDGTIDMLFLDVDNAGKLNPKLVKNFGGFENIASAEGVDNGDYVSTVLITRNGGQISMTDALNNYLASK